jgi:hypothetical protein
MRKRGLKSGSVDRTKATHVRHFPTGARLEFRKSLLGDGWASRAIAPNGRADNWIYFGPELPRDAERI